MILYEFSRKQSVSNEKFREVTFRSGMTHYLVFLSHKELTRFTNVNDPRYRKYAHRRMPSRYEYALQDTLYKTNEWLYLTAASIILRLVSSTTTKNEKWGIWSLLPALFKAEPQISDDSGSRDTNSHALAQVKGPNPKALQRSSSYNTSCHLYPYFCTVVWHRSHSETMTSRIVRGCSLIHALSLSFYKCQSSKNFARAAIIRPVGWINQVLCQIVFITVYKNRFLACVAESRCLTKAVLK